MAQCRGSSSLPLRPTAGPHPLTFDPAQRLFCFVFYIFARSLFKCLWRRFKAHLALLLYVYSFDFMAI